MYKSRTLIWMSLILCGLVTECFGLVIMPKDKRGWTLNSAGYLLGPHAANGHRSLTDKGGLAGKREVFDDNYKSVVTSFSNPLNSVDDNALQTLTEFLRYLRLRESGLLDNSAMLFSADQTQQA
ncbi:galanin peptides-like [Carcharodon carcharias]|uniref:galanin peptides-like n=1 Tax=Carcharodon carcharias TaxID=13397 RepID=UPI001B7EC512|nr:galanin peptides-like [Carcharodon carcharias]